MLVWWHFLEVIVSFLLGNLNISVILLLRGKKFNFPELISYPKLTIVELALVVSYRNNLSSFQEHVKPVDDFILDVSNRTEFQHFFIEVGNQGGEYWGNRQCQVHSYKFWSLFSCNSSFSCSSSAGWLCKAHYLCFKMLQSCARKRVFQWTVQEKAVRQTHPLSPYMAPVAGLKLKYVIKQFMMDMEKTELELGISFVVSLYLMWAVCVKRILAGEWKRLYNSSAATCHASQSCCTPSLGVGGHQACLSVFLH